MGAERLRRFRIHAYDEPGAIELVEPTPEPLAQGAHVLVEGGDLRGALIAAGLLVPRRSGDPTPESAWIRAQPCLSIRGPRRSVPRSVSFDDVKALERGAEAMASGRRRFNND